MGGDGFGQQLGVGVTSFLETLAAQGQGGGRGPSAFAEQQAAIRANPAAQRVAQGAKQQVEAPIPQDIQFPTQATAVTVPEAPATPAGGAPTAAPFPPPTGQAVLDIPEFREPTAEEFATRFQQLPVQQQALLIPEMAGEITRAAAIEQEKSELSAKTAQQKEVNSLILRILEGADQKAIAGGGAGLMLRSATVNPATGNIAFNLGRPTSEEQRAAQRTELQAAIMEAARGGDRTPLQAVIGLQARDENPLSLPPEEISGIMKNMAQSLVALQTQQGIDLGTATDNAFRLTGQIPEALEGFLPEAVINESRIAAAREVGKTQGQLSNPANELRAVLRQNEAAKAMTRAIIDFRAIEKPTNDQVNTRVAHLTAADALEQLTKDFDKAFVGPIRGRAGSNILDVFGQLKGGEQNLRTQIAKLKVATIQAITGAAMGETEAKRIMATIPDLADTPQVFMAKLQENARERMHLLRIHEAIVTQGGRRFQGEVQTKKVLIGDTEVEVVDVQGTMKLVDPTLQMSFDASQEAKMGVVALRDGSIAHLDPLSGETKRLDPARGTVAPGETPGQAAAAATPPGGEVQVSPAAQAWIDRINARLRGK